MRLPEQVHVAGVEHRSVSLDGFDAHVASAGASDGEPVVLVHGWPLHWWSFRHLIGALADDGRRVLAPDLRGFGWSGAPGWGDAPAQFTKDLFALLDALGVDQVDLVGHDWAASSATAPRSSNRSASAADQVERLARPFLAR
jgi:pimeloyl-ACP methyl ester carboxylesterase